MSRRGWGRWLILGLLALGGTATCRASACGGPDHHWSVRVQDTGDAYLRSVMARWVLAAPLGGLSNSPGDDSFEVHRVAFDGRRLDVETELGAFAFVLPSQVTQRESDIGFLLRPEPPPGDGGEPMLENEAPILRELVWQGRVEVPARFAPFMRPGLPPGGEATLVLQGLGNGCMDASDFRQWVLWIGDFRLAGRVAVRSP